MEEWNTIKVPCKTGDLIWFVDKSNYISWGRVLAFTETHIVVDSAYTEYKMNKEKVSLSEWYKTIVSADSREEAENKIKLLIPKEKLKEVKFLTIKNKTS